MKIFKFFLRIIAGNTSLTFEDLSNLTPQIEECVNSKPLCGMSSGYNDFSVLIPGYLITGKTLTAVPKW